MDKLNCYVVTCCDSDGNTYNIGVMSSDENNAMKNAEKSLFEGRKIKALAIEVKKTDWI